MTQVSICARTKGIDDESMMEASTSVAMATGLVPSVSVAGSVERDGGGSGGPGGGFVTPADPCVTLAVPGGVTPITTVGDELGDLVFEGNPLRPA